MSLVYLQFCNKEMLLKCTKKLLKIVNIDEENLHIFQRTGVMSMKFSGKTNVMIILKVTKKENFNLYLSLENTT